MWDLYTYWNSASMATALNAVAMVVGGGSFLGLLQSMAFIGLLASATIGLIKFSAKEPVQYLGILALVYGTLFLPKVTVTIQDVRSGNVQPVANVPLGVAFIATQTSHIGKYLTEFFETSFGGTDAEKFSKSGMSWSATAMEKLSSIPVNDDTLSSTMGEFVRACVNPEIQEDPSKLTQLVGSTDILEYLAGATATFLNPGRLVRMPTLVVMGAPPVYTAQAPYIMQPCPAAGSAIKLWIESKVNASQTWIGRQLYPDASAATAYALVGANLPFAEAALIGSSRTVAQQIKQAIAQQLVTDSTAMQSMLRGDAAAAQLAAGVATAKAAANSNYKTLAMIGSEALPKMRNIVEAVAISVFPIVILIIIISGERAFSVFAAYAMTFVWVQLWAPLYALINGLFNPMAAARIGQAMGNVSQTIMNTESMTTAALREQTMAGALVLAVPAIAYAIVKGGMAGATSALGAMTRGSEKSAETQGSAAGLGNYSFGNASWGNGSMNSMGANKWDSNIGHSDGRYAQSHGNVGQRHDMGSGRSAVDGSGTRSDLGDVSGQMAMGGMRALASQSQQMWNQAMQSMRGFSQELGAALNQVRGNFKSSGESNSVGETGGANWSSAAKEAYQRLQAFQQSAGRTDSNTSTHGFETKGSIEAGVSGAAPIPGTSGVVTGGAKTSSSETMKNERGTDLRSSANYVASGQLAKDVATVFGTGKTQGWQQGGTAGSSKEDGKSASLNKLMKSTEGLQEQVGNATSFATSVQNAQALSGGAMENLANSAIKIAGNGDSAVGAGVVSGMIKSGDTNGLANLMRQAIQSQFGGQGSMGGQPLGGDTLGVGSAPDQYGNQGAAGQALSGAEQKLDNGRQAVASEHARNKGGLQAPQENASYTPTGKVMPVTAEQVKGGVEAANKAFKAEGQQNGARGADMADGQAAATEASKKGAEAPPLVLPVVGRVDK